MKERLPYMYQLGLKKSVFHISPQCCCSEFRIKTGWRENYLKFPSYAMVTVRKSRLVDLMVCLQSKVPCSSTRPNARMILRPRVITTRGKSDFNDGDAFLKQ